MSTKRVLIAGATGLVGYAAMKHYASQKDCEVIAVSRRQPDHIFGTQWHPLDLTDAEECADLVGRLGSITHLVYAALYERPGLVAGWQEEEQIRTNEAMLRNLLGPLDTPALRHVALLQGTKAYGVHVRPLTVPARENRSEMHEQPNFYWNQERYVRALQAGKPWSWTILRPGPVSAEQLAAVLGASGRVAAETGMIEAPGQLASHYAPGKPVRLGATEAAADEFLIGFGAVAGATTLSATGDLAEAAARLYACLHEAAAATLPRIAVAPVPKGGIGAAINDRLRRAAA